MASGIGQSCLSAHVGEHARFHRRRIERVSAPRGVLCKYKDQTKYPDDLWVALHVTQGHYRTLGDFLKGIRQALRDEFGEELTDQDFKYNFDEDTKRVTITIKEWSCLALNPWMTNLLQW